MIITNERFYFGMNDWEVELPDMNSLTDALEYYGADFDEVDRIECLDEVIEKYGNMYARWTWDIIGE